MESISVRFEGKAPLLMHSDRLADPISPLSKAHKALTGKRNKTEEDHIAIAKSEYLASLYLDDDGEPCMPGTNLRASIIAGGKLHKLGSHVDRGALIATENVSLLYDGPRDGEALWADGRFVDARSVVVSRARLMRYRPMFKEWALEFTLDYDENIIDEDQLLTALDSGGAARGLGDYRPTFGRYRVSML